VDDVVFDAPYVITAEFLATMNIHVVVKGADPAATDEISETMGDPYQIPRERGILRILDAGKKLTVFEIMDRIQSQRERYVNK
jgi:glycerol-3-phosphate cytidylyltransferase-like family protein